MVIVCFSLFLYNFKEKSLKNTTWITIKLYINISLSYIVFFVLYCAVALRAIGSVALDAIGYDNFDIVFTDDPHATKIGVG